MHRYRWSVVAAALAFVSLGSAVPAHAAGAVTCVELGTSSPFETDCSIPRGSRLHVSGEAATCSSPSRPTEEGEILWTETAGSVVPRIPIPEYEWYEIRRLNEYYTYYRVVYEGEVRFFWKQCHFADIDVSVTLEAFPIAVPITDPVLDIRGEVAGIILSLPVPTPTLSTLPEPDVYYGLKVNNPAWIAVTPGSWQTVRSPTRRLRGWDVTIQLRPITMSFLVDQGARRLTVACDPGEERYVPGSSRFPTEPVGFTAEDNWFDPPEDPLPARPCSWTPRTAGAGTIAVSITYEATAFAGGRVFEFAPRTNTAVVPIDVTELRTVNLRPGV